MKAWTQPELPGVSVRPKLTPSEENVLRALCSGKSQKQIAAECGIHINTVYFHLINCRRKLGAPNTLGAVVVWLRHRGTA